MFRKMKDEGAAQVFRCALAVEVGGVVVPEPSSAVSIGLGPAALGRRPGKRRLHSVARQRSQA